MYFDGDSSMTIKLNGSTAGSVSLDAPASTTGSADIAFKLPVADGSANQVIKSDGSGNLGFTSLVSGITEFDSWYLTSNVTSNGNISANLSRQNKTGTASPLGTGMSESSGVFTFPSTGKWLVIVQAMFVCNIGDNVGLDTLVTINGGSNYSHTHRAMDGIADGGTGIRRASAVTFAFIDVTDTSQVKVKFAAASIGSGSNVTAEQSYVQTGFHFIRIGVT